MTRCSNCNTTLRKGTKFCTSCGSPIKEVKQPQKADASLTEIAEDSPKSYSKGTKIIIGLIAVVALFFIGRSLVTNIDITRNSISISKALSKIEGEWQDPSGVLLGDSEAIITFRKRGEEIIGEVAIKALYIALLAYSTNEYGGLVAINEDNENYTVHYDSNEDKLFFVGNLSQRKWYLQRINTKK